jgi:high-affinity iron transporter
VRVAVALLTCQVLMAQSAAEEPTTWQRLVSILQYLQSDYPAAASSQSATELAEQRSFVEEALESARSLGADGARFLPALESIRVRVERGTDPTGVSRDCTELVDAVVQAGGLARSPRRPPDLQKAAELYAVNCAPCHAADGSGNVEIAATLDPKPTNFLDRDQMGRLDPYKAFNAITFGVSGTALPSFSVLPEDDRWALAFFIFTLRQPPCDHQPPKASLEQLATATDAQLAAQFGDGQLPCLRRRPPQLDEEQSLLLARSGIEQSLKLAQSGKSQASGRALLDAYLKGIEPVEPMLRVRNPQLVQEIEQAVLRARLSAQQGSPQLAQENLELLRLIDRARQSTSSATTDFWSIFWLALLVIIREGFEASVVIAALLAVLKKTEQRRQERLVHLGWILAIALGALVFVFGRHFLAGANRELLEGIVALVAVGMLVYAALWLNARSNIRRMMGKLRNRMQDALGNGSAIGLFSIAFTAVFRESFETAVFLQGLSIDSPAGSGWGAAAGAAALVGLVIFVNRVGYRLPMKPLFNASTALLLITAVVLLGKGLHTLQALGALPFRPIASVQIDALGIYPDLYSLGAQLLLAIAPLVWISWRTRDRDQAVLTADHDSSQLNAK